LSRVYRNAVAIVFLVANACSADRPPARQTMPTEARVITAPPVGSSTLRELTETAEQVNLAEQGVEAAALTRVLDLLATASAELERSDHTARHVRAAVDDLQGGDPSSIEYADRTVGALGAVAAMVHAFGSRCGNGDVEDAAGRARMALARVDSAVALTEQPDRLEHAVLATVDAVLLAGGGAPVFTVPTPAAAASFGDEPHPATLEEHSLAMHRLLLKLGGARWNEARKVAGEVLLLCASALETSGRQAAIEEQIRDVRFQGERLRRMDGLAFARGDWIRSAVLSALDALTAVVPPERSRLVTPWIERAREAADALDARGAMSFQRAAVQEALRTMTDAFLAASQAGTK
jgi:hypothetical protein